MDDELRRLFRDISEMEARVHALRDRVVAHSSDRAERKRWRHLNSSMSSLASVSGLIYDILPPHTEGQCTCHEPVRFEGRTSDHWSYCPVFKAAATPCGCVGLQHREECPEHVVPL